MKKVKLILLVSVVFLLSSCFCDKDYQSAFIELTYPDISASTDVYFITLSNSETDTSFLKSLNQVENKITLLSFRENSKDSYFIYLEAFNHIDTISDFNVKRGKCDVIKSIDFEFNGVRRTSNQIEVFL